MSSNSTFSDISPKHVDPGDTFATLSLRDLSITRYPTRLALAEASDKLITGPDPFLSLIFHDGSWKVIPSHEILHYKL